MKASLPNKQIVCAALMINDLENCFGQSTMRRVPFSPLIGAKHGWRVPLKPTDKEFSMKCANCSFENPGDAKFCENCGKPLEMKCPNCGNPVSPGARFCKNCGYSLQAAPSIHPVHAAASPQALIDRYVTKEIASKIAAALTGDVEGERRIVTIFFADIKGSTALAEKLDPEDWAEIMNTRVRIPY